MGKKSVSFLASVKRCLRALKMRLRLEYFCSVLPVLDLTVVLKGAASAAQNCEGDCHTSNFGFVSAGCHTHENHLIVARVSVDGCS